MLVFQGVGPLVLERRPLNLVVLAAERYTRRPPPCQCDFGRKWGVYDEPARSRYESVRGRLDDCRLIIEASRPAPNPLSMFTTPIPPAQELSMASSAASPRAPAP